MITAHVRRDSRGQILAVTVEGHDSSTVVGNNLVCAAVSAMTDMTALGLVEVCRVKTNLVASKGLLKIELAAADIELDGVQHLLETLARALDRLGRTHGGAIIVRSE